MSLIISFLGQKGGSKRTSSSRLVAVECARIGLKVLGADTDVSQATFFNWNKRRNKNKIKPSITVRVFDRLEEIEREGESYDIIIIDGAPHATKMTAEIAGKSDLVVIPTGSSIDDLEAQIDLAHELVEKSIIQKDKILFLLGGVGPSKSETQDAISYLRSAGYDVVEETIPNKTAFRRAVIEGKTFTETPYKSLNEKCERVVQYIVNRTNI